MCRAFFIFAITMNIEEIRAYCLSIHPAITEDFPFDEVTLTFRIGNKIFALLPLDVTPSSINLKNVPEVSIELREKYPFIVPGFHMNKMHWNTVSDLENIDPTLLKELINVSFELIKHSLPRKIKDTL